jgi:hypothetical protein
MRQQVRRIGTIKARRNGLYAKDVVRIKELRTVSQASILLALTMSDEDDSDYSDVMMLLAAAVEMEAMRIGRDLEHIHEPIERRYLRFHTQGIQESFTQMFRFKVEHMPRLMQCLRIPAEFKLDNGSWVNGEEALMVMLRFMAYPTRQIDLETLFGWEHSRLSRISTWMKKYIFLGHRHRVQDYWDWHAPLLANCKEAIRRKRLRLNNGQDYQRVANVCGFYDGFRVQICRPSDMVREDADGNEYVLNIQTEVYSGYKKVC